MKLAPTACAILLAGSVGLWWCKKEETPAPFKQEPLKVILPDKWFAGTDKAKRDLKSLNGYCKQQIENILNREKNYTPEALKGWKRYKLGAIGSYQTDYSNLVRLWNPPDWWSRQWIQSSWIDEPLSEYGIINGKKYDYSIVAYDYCFILAQESLRNLHFSQEESMKAYNEMTDLKKDYIGNFEKYWFKPIHFNTYSNTVQIRNFIFFFGLLLAMSYFVLQRHILKNIIWADSIFDIQNRINTLKINEEEQEQLKELLKKQEGEMKEMKSSDSKNRTKIESLEKDLSRMGEDLHRTESEKSSLKWENSKLHWTIKELEASALLNCQIASQVGIILECGDEISSIVQRMQSLRESAKNSKEYGLFIAISRQEVEEKLKILEDIVLRLSAALSGDYQSLLLWIMIPYREAKACFESGQYKKAYEKAMICEWVGEFIESILLNPNPPPPDINNWSDFFAVHKTELKAIQAMDEDEKSLCDFFKILWVDPIYDWSEEAIQEILKTIKKEISKSHPDRNIDPRAHERTVLLNRISAIFSVREKCELYIQAYHLFFKS